MVIRKTSDDALVLPRGVISQFGTECFDVITEGNAIILRPRQDDPIEAIRDHIEKLGITEQDVEDAIRWARSTE